MMRKLVTLAIPLLAVVGSAAVAQFPAPRTQVRFTGPSGMQVRWYVRSPGGAEGYSDPPVVAPGRYSFRQGAGYRLKLSHLPGHPGLVLYPTLEVVATPDPAAQQFLAHSAVPLELTDDDLRQVTAGEYLVKAIYLPTGQEAAGSVPLAPGVDPIAEAGRRGRAVLVLRLGNRDVEAPAPPPGHRP